MHSKVYISNVHYHGIVYVQIIFVTRFKNLIGGPPMNAFSSLRRESQGKESGLHRGQVEISEFLRNLRLHIVWILLHHLQAMALLLLGCWKEGGKIREFQFIAEINGYQLLSS